MANELKRATGEATTLGASIYTVPVGSTSTIIGCRASNKTEVNVTVHFLVNGLFISGKDVPLPSGSAIDILGGSKIVLQENDEVIVFSDTNSAVDVIVSYLEQS